jgi:hypothetical protein
METKSGSDGGSAGAGPSGGNVLSYEIPAAAAKTASAESLRYCVWAVSYEARVSWSALAGLAVLRCVMLLLWRLEVTELLFWGVVFAGLLAASIVGLVFAWAWRRQGFGAWRRYGFLLVAAIVTAAGHLAADVGIVWRGQIRPEGESALFVLLYACLIYKLLCWHGSQGDLGYLVRAARDAEV